MPKRAPRRLTMADLAILIAGSALAIWLWKTSWQTTLSLMDGRTRFLGYRVGLAVAPASLSLAAALAVVRLGRPRPPWRIIFRQPGTSACLAILAHMATTVLVLSWRFLLVPTFGTPTIRSPNFNTYLYGNQEAGAWVAVAWATLALARAWRSEPSWIDRAGRVVGAVAILHWLCAVLIW